MHKLGYMFVCLLILTAWRPADAQTEEGRVKLDHADVLELIMSAIEDTTYATGSVIFTTEHGVIYCDSAVFVKAKSINLRGNVVLDDDEYRLSADSVYYNIPSGDMTALGSHVELWSRKDSLFAVGTQALFNRETEYFRMENRPTLYINYPDTASMIEVVADTIDYDSDLDRANAIGDVVISTKDLVSHSGRAAMYPDENRLELYEQPIARRRKSTITGKEMTIITENDLIKQIVVTDSARAEFEEPTDSTEVFWDKSILTGEHITLNFEQGELSRIVSWGQAYSWYYPSPQGKLETNENTVSGDTIRFTVINDELKEVEVIGGAVGTYLSGKKTVEDSTIILKVDTINYSSKYISYAIKDSMITLTREASIISGTVQLDAQKVTLDTDRRVIEAYSGDVLPDTALSPYEYSTILEPNEIPVRLKDREEEIYGDFLEYSIDTEKGRIVQSKSSYEKGTYYGQKVFRATKDIFYINNGRYTPCDINYLHFWASHMKLINNDKLIARPVVMYIGRLPMLALPYYVFPLKKGRHSGFLPFTVGNIETGANRYIRNVGYYWAASEYWDLLGALDYYEQNSTVNFSGEANWRKRYVFDGFFRVNVAHETSYFGPPVARETKETRYTLAGSHNHIFSPSFRMSASGQYQSDPAYYQDYSANLDERLNRTLHSQASFVKRFSDKVSLSGSVTHDDNLDTKSRTTRIPSLGLTLPVFKPFGSGTMNEEGRLVSRWYNNISVTYRPSLLNYYSRVNVDSVFNEVYDTTGGVDTLISADTISYFSRKKYTRFDHSLNLRMPLTIARYFVLNPGFSYSENWYKIYSTDQSEAAGISSSEVYRAYLYTVGTSLETKLYGTVYPNAFGLIGLRQVITPRVSYSYVPEINRNPEVRSYAGGGSGSASRRQSIQVKLDHDYQAKIAAGEGERNLELLSISHTFSYDLENTIQPYSNLVTTYRSNVLPRITLYGNMTHTFYRPGTDELHFWSPYLLSYDFNASMSFSGRSFLFDDPDQIPKGADSASQLSEQGADPYTGTSSGNWNMSVTFSHAESGRGSQYLKTSFIRFSLSFNLTPETSVQYSQYYDFVRHRTINNQVRIVRRLKCWTGELYWVPIGSNRGYGFRLYVTAIPSIKIDNSQNPFRAGYW